MKLYRVRQLLHAEQQKQQAQAKLADPVLAAHHLETAHAMKLASELILQTVAVHVKRGNNAKR